MEFTAAKAFRLGRRARGNGLLARRARRRLFREGDRGEDRYLAINEVWDLWFEAPDDELWAALTRWNYRRTGGGQSLVALGQAADAADVVAAARRAGHPIAAIARAQILAGRQELVDAACEAAHTDKVFAGFCVEHELAPSDPHRAAVYFLLTGQRERYRLADPDHSLLTVAYQGAHGDERHRIRTKAAGDPELVRVLADTVRRGRMIRLSEQEAEYLVDAFTERRDWPGLWELTKELPVVDAAAAARRFDGWRPSGADAALFDALAAADPSGLAESHRALTLPRPVRVPIPGTVTGGSFAPDGRRIVVTTSSSVDVFTLAEGTAPQHQEHWRTRYNCQVLALDDDVLVISNWDQHEPGEDYSDIGYVAHGDRPSEIFRFFRAARFGRTADGFAVLTYDQSKDSRWLNLLSGSGRSFTDYTRRDLDLRTELGLPAKVARRMKTMATEPESGMVAFAGQGLYLAQITDDGLRPLAYEPLTSGLNPYVAFSGPDRLITRDDERMLRIWRPDGDELRPVAEREVTGHGAVDLPAAGVIAVVDLPDNTRRWVRYLDRETLADVPTPIHFDKPGDPTAVFASPDGTKLAVGFYGFVEVIEVTLTGLADRPLAATTPADLHAVRARLDKEPANPLLELLHTCLAHRFGTEVALGAGGPATGRADDIALGGPA